MRITDLEIVNFKALTRFRLEELGDAVVLAGPNGCGKSCVLDAIKLLKSAYGGYQPNEWHSWFGELQINFNQRPEDLLRVFQDPSRELRIRGSIALAERELTYIRENSIELTRNAAWREVVPELASWRAFGTAPLAAQYRAHSQEVEERATQAVEELRGELEAGSASALITITTQGEITAQPSRLLELVFSSYEPEHLGVFDFHSPDRQYTREQVAGVNLDISSAREQRRQSALYNPQVKFQGLKAEMASGFVRRLLAGAAGVENPDDDLTEALTELFRTFFPGKEFAGPRPTDDGRVEFPVTLPDASTHDLDDLSSGEKEVLYGYMRLRSSATRDSVILLDEPELHLNPRLVRGLARFYYNHLVTARSNQLWLISHSDTLLREAVNLDGFRVYHMRSGDRSRPEENQAAVITTGEEVERLVIELVGDLAAYRPGAKVVLFEGGGDVEFDVRMVARLFPEFDAAVNAIAAGGKKAVNALHETLERVGSDALGARFYSVRDRDTGPREEAGARVYTWDVYHIENYLLEPQMVLRAMEELSQADQALDDESQVDAALKRCASQTISALVRHELIVRANGLLLPTLDFGGDPSAENVAEALYPSIESSAGRVEAVFSEHLSLDELKHREAELRNQFAAALDNGDWRRTFRGRDILKRFVAEHINGANYEAFRDLVVARMKETGYQPAGMQAVLDGVLQDVFP